MTTSLAVWDVPMPVVIGESFAVKVGAAGGKGAAVEVSDPSGKVVASGTLGGEPLAGTEALYWTTLDVPAPGKQEAVQYTVRSGGAASQFAVTAAPKPEHTLTVTITERETHEPLGGVEVRLGAFRARTDKSGHASLRIARGSYQMKLWRNGHIAADRTVGIDGDMTLAVTMLHVPEEHPDARWVR
ncbi:MAG: hypothetical protein WCG92_02500 [Hyphomicrobiales bacterium]|nr:hypothetical protein [Alphaproteobacteria bacterium]